MKRKGVVACLFASVLVYGAVASRVTRSLSIEDRKAVRMLGADDQCGSIKSFQHELNCIKAVQAGLHELVPTMRCRGRFISAEPIEFIDAGYGCCYDRSRFIEKALQYYGFKVRHVHLNSASQYGFLSFLIPGTPSHSTLEAKTMRGWLGVDSNERFLLVDWRGRPFTYSQAIKSGLVHRISGNSFYDQPLQVVYGLYSRHGTFYPPYFPFFEFSYEDLRHNLRRPRLHEYKI